MGDHSRCPLPDGGHFTRLGAKTGGLQPRAFFCKASHVALADHVAGHPHQIAIGHVGGELAHADGECPLAELQQRLRVLADGGLQGEDLADPRVVIAVVWRQRQHMTGRIRLMAVGNAHPGGNSHIDAEATLRVQQGATTPGMGLRRRGHIGGELGRDAIAKLVRLLVVAVAIWQILFIHQDIDRFRHAVDTEHGDETILIQQPLLDQEAVEEAGLIMEESGTRLDQLGGQTAVVGQQATEEIIDPPDTARRPA